MRYESCGGFSHLFPSNYLLKYRTKHLTLYRKTGIIKVEIEKKVNKIKGVSTAYFRENADELDGEIIVRLKV